MRIVIADDEPIARRRLRRLLAAEPDIDDIRECATGVDVLKLLSEQSADVLFLDIQMPVLDGLTVAKGLAPANAPRVVFVTAYDEYAVEAFAVRAFDYLLKPFDGERFLQTLDFLRRDLSTGVAASSVAAFSSLWKAVERHEELERIAVRNRGTVSFVDVSSIEWIEAADNYVCVHTRGGTQVLRETLNAMEARLDQRRFQRVHRSAIVNIARVKQIQPWFRGDARIILESGATVALSRTYRQRVSVMLLGRRSSSLQ